MQTIIKLFFSATLWFMLTVATIMIVPILWYLFTTIAQIMNNNFDITIRILCWFYTVYIAYKIRNEK